MKLLSLGTLTTLFAVGFPGILLHLVKQERQNADAPIADQLLRFYGTQRDAHQLLSTILTQGKSVSLPLLGFSAGPAEKFRPRPVISGLPLIEPRGMVKGRGYLYIADSGKDESHNEPATIWRLEPFSKKLDVFFRGTLLVNSKWLWYHSGAEGKNDEILVSDFGEENGHHHDGTGVGAKIFAIEVKPDGTAGATRILHEGAPFLDPQGITVVGDTVIVADTRAGELTQRDDAPDVKFHNGILWAVPLEGGPPTRLFPNQKFVTLVGSCVYEFEGQLYLRLWDIDGNRRDMSKLAWMDHSGFAALRRARITSVSPLKFGPLEDIPFIEEFAVKLKLDSFRLDHGLIFKGVDGTTFSGGVDTIVLSEDEVKDGGVSVIASSPTSKQDVSVEVIVPTDRGEKILSKRIDIRKNDSNPGAPMRDNKHAGAMVAGDQLTRLDTSVDGLSRTLSLFPLDGGVIGNIWQGAPFATPMASQPSWDGKVVWVSDLNGGPGGAGAIWQVPLPSMKEMALMYAPGNAFRGKPILIEH